MTWHNVSKPSTEKIKPDRTKKNLIAALRANCDERGEIIRQICGDEAVLEYIKLGDNAVNKILELLK